MVTQLPSLDTILSRAGSFDGDKMYKDKYDKVKYQAQYYKEHKEKLGDYQKEYREAHREKIQAYHKEYYETNKKILLEKSREYRQRPEVKFKRKQYELNKTYNISVEEYDKLWESQNGVCAICGQPETSIREGKIKPLSVDHDHETGKIRGLLCNRCNRALGMFEDSPDLLLKASAYLREKFQRGSIQPI